MPAASQRSRCLVVAIRPTRINGICIVALLARSVPEEIVHPYKDWNCLRFFLTLGLGDIVAFQQKYKSSPAIYPTHI